MPTARIALIHAVIVAIDPVKDAFAQIWPEATLVNILDDSLSPDRARDHMLTSEMSARIGALGNYAVLTGCAGILFTCSAFGEGIEKFAEQATVPTLKPNEAMFDAALAIGSNIGMLATFGPSVTGMEAEFYNQARIRGRQATIKTVLVESAMRALRGGDVEKHNELLADAVPQLGNVDVILLAHFSTSRALSAVSRVTPQRVLSSPSSAVQAMKNKVCG